MAKQRSAEAAAKDCHKGFVLPQEDCNGEVRLTMEQLKDLFMAFTHASIEVGAEKAMAYVRTHDQELRRALL